MEALAASRVAVFGIGGVGSFAAEALVRGGIGAIDIIDNDTVNITNLNRQLYALHSTIGRYKVDVAEERIHDINPLCRVTKHCLFYTPETANQFDFTLYDYVVDCIDTVTGKIQIVLQAQQSGTPVISSMGTGNKTDPSLLEVSDIYKTSVCPLARVMRRELKARGIKHLKTVYSRERVIQPAAGEYDADVSSKKPVPGSTSFVPSSAGLLLAAEVIRYLAKLPAAVKS